MERMYGGISKFVQVPPILEAYAKNWVHDMKTQAPHLDISFDARHTLRAEAVFRKYGRK